MQVGLKAANILGKLKKHPFFCKTKKPKNSMKKIYLSLISLFLFSALSAQVLDEFRSLNRDGIFDETGLLKSWPAEGPQLLWANESLLEGHSSMTFAYDKIYLTGIQDTLDVAIALDMQGNVLWQTPYGRAWMQSFPKSRSTPTIENEKIYVTSGVGDVACLNALNGEIIWQVTASEDNAGTYGRWGIAESLLILDEKIFFTCGGPNTTMIALNKETGETIWKTKTLNTNPSYSSAILIERDGKKIISNVTEKYIIGVNPEDGNILWEFSFDGYAQPPYHANIHCNMPIYYDGKLFITSGYNHRNIMLELSKDLSKAYFVYTTDVLDTHHGGVVKIGDYVYGTNWENNRMGRWVCMDWNTGETHYETEWINKGSIIAADGMLYCYEEKTGNLALVPVNPEKFEIVSSFTITQGNRGPFWSHPVIKDGILYIRHLNALMAYNLKQ